jgi:hypothetical protein
MEFKPYPGDFASAGGSFHGDWVIDENDRTRFIAALDGTSPGYLTGANLLSFDMNRDGAIDCADWPLFAAAFEASSGYAPELPDTLCTLCPSDIADSKSAAPDGTVNVFDLLELLSNWNTNGPGAAIAEPSDVVNVFDLLELLSAWGEC